MPEPIYSIGFRPGPEIGWKDHRPMTLAEVWRELTGAGCVAIISPTGRVAARRGYGGWEFMVQGAWVDHFGLRRHLAECRARSRKVPHAEAALDTA